MTTFALTANHSVNLNELYRFSVAESGVSKVGREKIKALLYETTGFPAEMPPDWDWNILVTDKGEYTGKLPNRISKYVKWAWDKKLPADVLARIGDIANLYNGNGSLEYLFDFTRNFNWQRGEFGDSDSCFFGGRDKARTSIVEGGGAAIRFYRETEQKRPITVARDGTMLIEGPLPTVRSGWGRAWLTPCEPLDDTLIIWNGYGLQTLPIAQTLAAFLGLEYKKISLNNQGLSMALVWVNDNRDTPDGSVDESCGAGYLLGPQEHIASIDKYSMHYADDSIGSCHAAGCGKLVSSMYSEHRVIGSHRYCKTHSRNAIRCAICREVAFEVAHRFERDLCENCAREHIVRCAHCHEAMGDWQGSLLDSIGLVCNRCLDEEYAPCSNHGGYALRSTMHRLERTSRHAERWVCADCVSRINHCCNCHEEYLRNELASVEHHLYCPTCVDKLFARCYSCDTWHAKDKIISFIDLSMRRSQSPRFTTASTSTYTISVASTSVGPAPVAPVQYKQHWGILIGDKIYDRPGVVTDLNAYGVDRTIPVCHKCAKKHFWTCRNCGSVGGVNDARCWHCNTRRDDLMPRRAEAKWPSLSSVAPADTGPIAAEDSPF